MAQWRQAAAALQRVQDDELRALSDDDAARAVAAVLSLPRSTARDAAQTSGLVEQQRLFARARHR